MRLIVRDFEEELLEQHVELVRRTAEEIVGAEPRRELEVDVRPQYPNMRDHLEGFPEVVADGRGARCAPRGSSRCGRRSAAAPTARC